MDYIQIQDLTVFCHHGVTKEENVLGQKFMVSIKLFTDLSKAGKSDDLGDSIDYGEVSHYVNDIMKGKHYKLIETVAEDIATNLLVIYDRVNEVEVEVKKPWAPILLPLDFVSVCIRRKRHRVYISIGSNIEPRRDFIDKGIEELEKDKMINNVKCSPIIETKPYGYEKQDDFLNGAICIDTLYTPEELLDRLHEIENKLGRKREIHWGPRTLDLDILLYDDMIMDGEELTIPHKEMHLREFVLEPMVSIAPYAVHPVFKKSITELYENIKEK